MCGSACSEGMSDYKEPVICMLCSLEQSESSDEWLDDGGLIACCDCGRDALLMQDRYYNALASLKYEIEGKPRRQHGEIQQCRRNIDRIDELLSNASNT